MVTSRQAAAVGIAGGVLLGFVVDRQVARSQWRQEHRRSQHDDPVRPAPEYEYFGDFTYGPDGRRVIEHEPPDSFGRVIGSAVPTGAALLATVVGAAAVAHASSTPIDLVASRARPVVALTGAAMLLVGVAVGSVASWVALG